MSRRARSRLGWWALAAIPVLAGAWWLASAFETESVSEVQVVRDDLSLTVEVSGTLQAKESVFLGPPQVAQTWQFRIAYMTEEGEQVAEGTPVLIFDSTELQQELVKLQAEVVTAEKEIEEAEKDIEVERRDRQLASNEERARLRKATLKMDRPEELQTGQDLAVARLDLKSAEQAVAHSEQREALYEQVMEARLAGLRDKRDRARQRVREVENAISQMTRSAPREGTVIYVSDWSGTKRKVGDNCWRGGKVIELPDLSVMLAEGQVDEADAGQLAEGQRVTLRLDAHPDIEFTGRVDSILKAFEEQSWTNPIKVARLEIELDSSDRQRMRPGMRFRGWIETERASGVLVLPLDAVEVTEQGPVVYRKGVLGYEPVRVELGRRSDTQVEVLGGLQEGDVVQNLAVTPRGSAT